jgi:hypothetical protein
LFFAIRSEVKNIAAISGFLGSHHFGVVVFEVTASRPFKENPVFSGRC